MGTRDKTPESPLTDATERDRILKVMRKVADLAKLRQEYPELSEKECVDEMMRWQKNKGH